jgi:two-component system chemotaxis response regulator CheY
MNAAALPLLLVVDDDPDQLYVIAHAAGKAGNFRVETADNAAVALAMLQARVHENGPLPDVILTDLKMPDLNGIEFARDMKRAPELRHIPVVVLTSGACPREERAAGEAGITAFVQKPALFDELVAAIKALPVNTRAA